MVSAVHPYWWGISITRGSASKGLHMVSAVHRPRFNLSPIWSQASKGLHMVSAVHRGQQRPMSLASPCSFKGAAHG